MTSWFGLEKRLGDMLFKSLVGSSKAFDQVTVFNLGDWTVPPHSPLIGLPVD
jgi:hypothetical protein